MHSKVNWLGESRYGTHDTVTNTLLFILRGLHQFLILNIVIQSFLKISILKLNHIDMSDEVPPETTDAPAEAEAKPEEGGDAAAGAEGEAKAEEGADAAATARKSTVRRP